MRSTNLSAAMIGAAMLGAASLAPIASAQAVRQEAPEPGTSHVAAIGDEVWSLRRFEGVPGVITQAPVYAEWSSSKVINDNAGSEYVIIRDKNLKACRARNYTDFNYSIISIEFKGWDDCLIDKDEDGAFELATYKKLGGSKKLQPPVPYVQALVPRQARGAAAIRESVIYLGTADNIIRLGYRQYVNDVPQPAYSEQAVIEKPKSFPATVSILDRKFTILGISADGISYRIEP